MSWVYFSLLSAVCSGVVYAFYGELLKKISVYSLTFYSAVLVGIFFFILSYIKGDLLDDWEVVKKDDNVFKYLAIVVIASIAAEFTFFMGMKLKNPTASSFMEVTAPIFTAVAAWLVFRQNQFSLGLIFGGLLILSGVVCIMYFNEAV